MFGSTVAAAQRALFDLKTIKEIIVNSPNTPSAENVVKIRYFFSSASFAFNARVSWALLDNGRFLLRPLKFAELLNLRRWF